MWQEIKIITQVCKVNINKGGGIQLPLFYSIQFLLMIGNLLFTFNKILSNIILQWKYNYKCILIM